MSSALEDILAVATTADVLEFAGIEPPQGRKNIRCPFPDHFDGKPSFSVSLQSGKGYHCHGCGRKGGVLELAIALELDGAKSKSQAVTALARRYGITEQPMQGGGGIMSLRSNDSRRKVTPHRPTPPTSLSVRETLDEEKLAKVQQMLGQCVPLKGTIGETYLRGRGFERDAADACGAMLHPNWYRQGPAVIFPVTDADEKTVALIGRFCHIAAPTDATKAKVLAQVSFGVFATPGALKTSKNGAHGPVAICEAPLDAIALAVSGMPAIALCGVNVPERGKPRQWLTMKLAGKPVCLAFDEDEAGHKAAQAMKEVLSPFGGLITDLSFDEAKDAAELLQRDSCKLYEMVQDRQSYIREQYWTLLEPDISELSLARDLAAAKGTLLGQNRFEVVELPFAA